MLRAQQTGALPTVGLTLSSRGLIRTPVLHLSQEFDSNGVGVRHEEQMERMRRVLQQLQKQRLSVEMEKCGSARTNVQAHGQDVGIGASQMKSAKVRDWLTTALVGTIRSFLGWADQNRRVLERRSAYASLLTDWLRELWWSRPSNLEVAFDGLEMALDMVPILQPLEDPGMRSDAADRADDRVLIRYGGKNARGNASEAEPARDVNISGVRRAWIQDGLLRARGSRMVVPDYDNQRRNQRRFQDSWWAVHPEVKRVCALLSRGVYRPSTWRSVEAYGRRYGCHMEERERERPADSLPGPQRPWTGASMGGIAGIPKVDGVATIFGVMGRMETGAHQFSCQMVRARSLPSDSNSGRDGRFTEGSWTVRPEPEFFTAFHPDERVNARRSKVPRRGVSAWQWAQRAGEQRWTVELQVGGLVLMSTAPYLEEEDTNQWRHKVLQPRFVEIFKGLRQIGEGACERALMARRWKLWQFQVSIPETYCRDLDGERGTPGRMRPAIQPRFARNDAVILEDLAMGESLGPKHRVYWAKWHGNFKSNVIMELVGGLLQFKHNRGSYEEATATRASASSGGGGLSPAQKRRTARMAKARGPGARKARAG